MMKNGMQRSVTKERYIKGAIPGMTESFGRKNLLSLPRIEKVVVNAGIGKYIKEENRLDEIEAALAVITGQKPLRTIARKAIAGFKLREGMEVGMKVTLHGERMWDFLDRLLNVALPRTRDFQGIPRTTVDQSGNCNIGIKEQTIFPEIVPEKVQTFFGFQMTIVTTARTKAEGDVLFGLLGFPFCVEEETKKR